MRELSLFSGAGGGLLATVHLLGWTPIGYVEWDDYCQRVLRARIDDGLLPVAPIFTDVREFIESGVAAEYRGLADVVTGGFPCQPFSVAGKQRAADDERNMWPATIGVIRAVRPRYAFLENVPGLLAGSHGYFGRVLGDLAEAGYDARWCVLGADDVGAPHRRKRLWIRATNTERESLRDEPGRLSRTDGTDPAESRYDGGTQSLADADLARPQGRQRAELPERAGQWPLGSRCSWWDADPGSSTPESSGEQVGACGQPRENSSRYSTWGLESRLDRVADGVAHRVDRLRAIGNGQVPAVAALAWRIFGGE